MSMPCLFVFPSRDKQNHGAARSWPESQHQSSRRPSTSTSTSRNPRFSPSNPLSVGTLPFLSTPRLFLLIRSRSAAARTRIHSAKLQSERSQLRRARLSRAVDQHRSPAAHRNSTCSPPPVHPKSTRVRSSAKNADPSRIVTAGN